MKKKSNTLSLLVGLGLSFFFFFVVVKRIISKNMNVKKIKEDDARKAEMAKRVYTGKSSDGREKKSKAKAKPVTKSDSQSLTERESKIMSLFLKKKEVSMDDITGILEGITVRTIRRDLTNLAKKKLIKKEGKTKGSTYVTA